MNNYVKLGLGLGMVILGATMWQYYMVLLVASRGKKLIES